MLSVYDDLKTIVENTISTVYLQGTIGYLVLHRGRRVLLFGCGELKSSFHSFVALFI